MPDGEKGARKMPNHVLVYIHWEPLNITETETEGKQRKCTSQAAPCETKDTTTEVKAAMEHCEPMQYSVNAVLTSNKHCETCDT